MTLRGNSSLWAAALLAGQLLSAASPPQALTNSPAPPPEATADIGLSDVDEPPLPPTSPVEMFRELLAMNAEQRTEFIADRWPENRKAILAKVREYESLRPDLRELRLRVTELHWYLLPLMKAPPASRAAQLAMIPPEDRKLVTDRLQVWDILPPTLQQELLENEATIRYFTEIASGTAAQKRSILEGISPARRARLEAGIAEWQTLPETQRRQIVNRFNQFFELTPDERQKALNTLSWRERLQIEKTLQTFGSLPPAERAQCINSFQKFASLSLQEREQFLKNAQRWKLMTPDERQAWRDLVNKLSSQPPVPPELGLPPLPPMPPPLPPLPPPLPGK